MSETERYKLNLQVLVELPRDTVQAVAADWCKNAFGVEHATNIEQRAVRFLEEAIELYQACGGQEAMAYRLVEYNFKKPLGDPYQEMGGVGVTLLALSAAIGKSADDAEKVELARVLSKPAAFWAARNEKKNRDGFNVTGVPTGAAQAPQDLTSEELDAFEESARRMFDGDRQKGMLALVAEIRRRRSSP